MPQNGKIINSQYIEKQRKKFFKNFKKTLYINVHLCDEKNKHKAMGSESALNVAPSPLPVIASGQRLRGNLTRRRASHPAMHPSTLTDKTSSRGLGEYA